MLFSALLLSTLLGLASCANETAVPKYIVFSNGQSNNVVTTFGNRLVGTQSIGEARFHFVSDLSAEELKRLNGSVTENTPVQINWHQKRIIQRAQTNPNVNFPYKTATNINMYVIDTGVDLSHPEFRNNNRRWGGNWVGDGQNTDCHGHGTHVASLATGEQYGVARRTNLIALKVLGCSGSGSTSGIISAIDWAVKDAQTTGRLSVINMSLGGSLNAALNSAVRAARNQGVYVVVAAGNSNADACYASPASATSAITVAASDSSDRRASFSNFGSCVDVYAPGVGLTAAWPNNQAATLSGTSMASPVAAGVLALHLSRSGTAGLSRFTSDFSNDLIKSNPSGTLNRFVYLNPAL